MPHAGVPGHNINDILRRRRAKRVWKLTLQQTNSMHMGFCVATQPGLICVRKRDEHAQTLHLASASKG